jgi:hypothetical protein
MRQLVPFQRAAYGETVLVELVNEPTAAHALAAVQATPDSETELAPTGVGTDCQTHALPFHSTTIAPALPVPTVKQLVAELHETPVRLPITGPVSALSM